MSKPEANLCSYRISVLNTDLQKALNPSIWPLRVRVREFIHYSNKPKQSGFTPRGQNDREAAPRRDPRGGQQQYAHPSPSYLAVPTFSRFEPLMAGTMLNNQQQR